MTNRIETLEQSLRATFNGTLAQVVPALGELTVEVKGADMHRVAQSLRDLPEFAFSQLIDLCGLDYLDYAHRDPGAPRFAVVYHLLSIQHNRRLRVRAACADDDLPRIESVVDVWPSADWFEREAFDLYGILFEGHPDLRRILTDYGFIGHPFRKDFPLSGNVEMRYDPDQQRVIYQPVTIEPREITPRVVREENYAEGPGFRNG